MMSDSISLFLILACTTNILALYPVTIQPVIPKVTTATSQHIGHRLPNNTRPISYNVHLTTHVHTQTHFHFTGEVAIRFTVLIPSRTITLHQRQLTIGNATLVSARQRKQSILLNPPKYNSVNEFLTFGLNATSLIVGIEYILTIQYSGVLRTDNSGFHRSSYLADDGTTRWLAVTQFQQTDARHGFPCFDEPALRALFNIRVTHGSEYHALSNMPIVSTVPASTDGYSTTTFQVTAAPMPTYLVAIVVSDFASLAAPNEQGFVQRIFARSNAIKNAQFGLETAVKCLAVFEQHFDTDFTFPKLDQVAVPDRVGAMENWGLITYIELRLLINETASTFYERRGIVITVAHEIVHQWFGNLVSLSWWTYIWMNEGLATLYGYYGADWLFPEWRVMESFVYFVIQDVMIEDSGKDVRPITHYVERTTDIARLFDQITYSKSSCILYMLQSAFTEKSFKLGLIAYLKTNTNTDVTEDELFAELEKAVKADRTLDAEYNVATIFRSWSRQGGFPIVSLERIYETGDIVLNQERYQITNGSTMSTSIWWIPYNIVTRSTPYSTLSTQSSWFSTRTTSLSADALNNTDWVLMNPRQTGYYRVKYDLQNYRLLSDALVQNHSQFDVTIRSQLIDDAFDMAHVERISFKVALDFLLYLDQEHEFVPWASALRGLEYLERLYSGNQYHTALKAFLLNQMSNYYNDLGLVPKPNELHFRKEARNQITRFSCHLGGQQCLNETSNILTKYLTKNVAIHPDHRVIIMCSGMRTATKTHYYRMISLLRSEKNTIERKRIVAALSCTENIELIRLHLHASIGDETSYLESEQERSRAFFKLAGNCFESTREAIDLLQTDLDKVHASYGRADVNRAIVYLSSFVVSKGVYNQFNYLLEVAHRKRYIDPLTISRSLTNINANIRWISLNEGDITEWVRQRQRGSAGMVISNIYNIICIIVFKFLM